MYKKIKNGSFINWIWFIIAAIPFILLLIYSIGFFNNEDLRHIDRKELQINNIEGSTLKSYNNYLEYGTLTFTNRNSNEGNANDIMRKNENGSYYYNVSRGNSKETSWKFDIEQLDFENNNYYFYAMYSEGAYNNYNIFQVTLFYSSYQGYSKTYSITTNNMNNFTNINVNELYNQIISEHQDTTFLSIRLQFIYANSGEFNAYYFLLNDNIYINENMINNYLLYNSNLSVLNYNSCPISYTYNNEIYELETNNNNYLGENEFVNINNNLDYIENENITINYNNYMISNVIDNNIEYYEIESTIDYEIIVLPKENYYDFLNNLLDTFKTNGFISSMFLNLVSMFNITNVYISLACYYIEYLLVIILLHLAFDLIYIVPNICHKFMEKIGGERD